MGIDEPAIQRMGDEGVKRMRYRLLEHDLIGSSYLSEQNLYLGWHGEFMLPILLEEFSFEGVHNFSEKHIATRTLDDSVQFFMDYDVRKLFETGSQRSGFTFVEVPRENVQRKRYASEPESVPAHKALVDDLSYTEAAYRILNGRREDLQKAELRLLESNLKNGYPLNHNHTFVFGLGSVGILALADSISRVFTGQNLSPENGYLYLTALGLSAGYVLDHLQLRSCEKWVERCQQLITDEKKEIQHFSLQFYRDFPGIRYGKAALEAALDPKYIDLMYKPAGERK